MYPLKYNEDFIKIFGKEFNINHPQLGAIVDASPHRKWSHEYNKAWGTFVNRPQMPNAQETIRFAQKLAKQYGFKWGK